MALRNRALFLPKTWTGYFVLYNNKGEPLFRLVGILKLALSLGYNTTQNLGKCRRRHIRFYHTFSYQLSQKDGPRDSTNDDTALLMYIKIAYKIISFYNIQPILSPLGALWQNNARFSYSSCEYLYSLQSITLV